MSSKRKSVEPSKTQRVGEGSARAVKERSRNKTYEQIQVAALSLLAEKGVESTSIRDISSKAKVPTSLLYHYATSKLQLVYELMVDGMERYQSSASDARALGDTPEEKLVALCTVHVINHCRNRQLAKLIGNGWQPLPNKDKAEMLKMRDNYSRLWDEVLLAGIEDKVFDITSPRLARLAIVQMVSVSSWYKPKGPLDWDGIAEHFSDFALGITRAQRKGKPLRFADINQPQYDDVLAIVEKHHQGAVFGRKR